MLIIRDLKEIKEISKQSDCVRFYILVLKYIVEFDEGFFKLILEIFSFWVSKIEIERFFLVESILKGKSGRDQNIHRTRIEEL